MSDRRDVHQIDRGLLAINVETGPDAVAGASSGASCREKFFRAAGQTVGRIATAFQ